MELRIATLTPEQKRDYDRYIDNMRSLEDVVDSAWSSGHFEGKAEGRAEGIAEGKWEDARNFYKLGVDLDIISKATGISIEELRAKLNGI